MKKGIGIVIFIVIVIISLGLSIYLPNKDKINDEAEDKSVIYSVIEENGKYGVKNQDEKVIEGNNQQDIKTTVKLDAGKNKIVVKATDEMNHLVEYEQEYTVGNLAQIDLNNVDNAVKLTVTSVEKIKTVSYKWDDEQEKVI